MASISSEELQPQDQPIELDSVILELIRDAATSADLFRVALVAFAAGRRLTGNYELQITSARLVPVSPVQP